MKDALGDFEKFLEVVSIQFGRKANGIRGRLAKYYPDIPGWDPAQAAGRTRRQQPLGGCTG